MFTQDLTRRLRYGVWAAKKGISQTDRKCPACGGDAAFVRRKLLVVSLLECPSCGLRFRAPKDDEDFAEYYHSEYTEDYAGQRPPSPEQLRELIRTGFANDPDKSFARYIDVLKAAGLQRGDSMLDFGASWGGGSWQFRQAGFKVYSYELSKPRSAYAKDNLGCTVIENIADIPEKVKCLFSSHVIEHLPDPSLIWKIGNQVLRDDGTIVVFCPNGEPAREPVIGRKQYSYLWPQVHPMVITPRFARNTSARYGYRACCFSTPYELGEVSRFSGDGNLQGDELCIVARREESRDLKNA